MHESEVAQSCPTLSDPMDCSPPGSSIHGIFQARVLEWGQKSSRETKEQTNRYESLKGINSRITETEERTNNLEDIMVEITVTEYRKKNEKK